MDPKLQEQLAGQWQTLSQERKSIVLDESYRTAVHALVASGAIADSIEEDVVAEVLFTVIDLQTPAELAEVLTKQHALTATAASAVVAEANKLIGVSPVAAAGTSTTPAVPEVEKGPCTPAGIIESDTEMKNRLQRLPEEVRTVITSEERGNAFKEIISSQSLDEPRARLLCERVTKVMLGMATTKELEMLLQGGTVVSPTQAKSLLATVEKVMLSPVRKAIVATLESRKGAKQEDGKNTPQDPYREPV